MGVEGGAALFGAAVRALLLDGRVAGFAHLPVSGTVGEHCGLLGINSVVRALLAALLNLHGWREIAVDAGEHHGGSGFLNVFVFADFFRRRDFALNGLEAAVGIGSRDHAGHAGMSSGW